jgi:hypothetical protein
MVVLIELNYKTKLHNSRSRTSFPRIPKPRRREIVDEDEDIFISVVNHYAVVRPREEEESSDEEEVKEVDTAKALRAVETVKMWKLQKGDSQDLQALDRLAREITQYKISAASQTTIHRFFKPK